MEDAREQRTPDEHPERDRDHHRDGHTRIPQPEPEHAGTARGPAHLQPREGPALDHEQLDAHEIDQGDHDQPDQEADGQVGVREARQTEQLLMQGC